MNRSGESRRVARRTLRAAAIGVGGLAGLCLALGLAVVLLLQTDRTATWTARQVLARVQVYPGAEVRLGRFRIHSSGWIEARDARLVETGTVLVASLARVELRVDWNALRRGELQIDSLRVEAPVVDLNPLLRGLATGSKATPSPNRHAATGRQRIRLAYLSVSDGELRLPLTLHGKPAVLAVRALAVRASQVAMAPGVALQLDSLGAELTLPELPHPAMLRARGALRGGRATLDSLHLDTPATHLVLCGAAPVQGGLDSLLANLQADFVAGPLDGADLRPFVATVPPDARLEASIHVALQGSQPAQANGIANAVLADARWGAHTVPRAQLETAWTGGRVQVQFTGQVDGKQVALDSALRPFDATVPYDLEIRAGSGSVALRGEVVPRAGPRWRIDAGTLRHFDLAALVPNTPGSDLTGSLQGNGNGLAADSLSLDAEIRLAGSRVATLPIDSLHATVALRAGALTLAGDARAHGTAVRLDAHAQPFAAEPLLESATVRFETFDLARWVPGAKPSTRLGGTLTLVPPGLGLQSRRCTARLRLTPSRVGEQSIDDGEFNFKLDGNALGVHGSVQFPGGGFTLEASARPFGTRPAYEVQRFDFTTLDVGALLGQPGLRTHLTGSATLEGEGTSREELRAHATLRLERSDASGMVLDGAHADAGYDAGAVRLVGEVSVPGGGGSIDASGALLDSVPTYEARGTLHSTSLAQLFKREIPDAQAQIGFSVEGAGFDRHALNVAATVTGSGSLGTARLDSLAAALSITGDVLRLDSLRMRGNVLHAQAAGSLRLPQFLPAAGETLQVTAQVIDPAPLVSALGLHRLRFDAGRLEAMLRGTDTGAALDGRVDAGRIAWDTLTAAGLRLRVTGTLDRDRRVLASHATAALDTLRVAGVVLRSAAAAADYDHETLHLTAAGAMDDTNGFRIAAHGPLDRQSVSVLDTLALRVGSNVWALDHPVQVAHDADRIRVDDLQLASGIHRWTIDGALDRHGEQSLVARADSLQIDLLARVLGWPHLKGGLDGELRVTGPAAAPRAAGRLALNLSNADLPPVTLESRFVHENNGLELQARLTNLANDSLVVAGRLPFAIPGLAATVPDTLAAPAALDVRAEADGFDLGSLAMFAPPNTIRNLAGRLRVHVHVTGSTRTPRLEGDLGLEEGAVQVMSLGAPYTGVSLAATLANDELRLDRLSARSGRGTLQAHGGIRFGAPRAVELALTFDRFRATANRLLRVEASGKLDVSGTLTAPVVRGSLALTDTDIDVSGNAAGNTVLQVQLTEADLRMLEDNFGYRPLASNGSRAAGLDAAKLEVEVEVGRDTWVRRRSSPRLALEITGRVDARKQPQEKLQVFGRLDVLPQRSYAEQLGRRFDVETGSVVLNGDPLQALINFAAKWEVPSAGNENNPEATITLKARGTTDDLRLKFTSDPPMDETQILTYITTGRPPQGTTGQVQKDSGASSAGAAMAFAQASVVAEEMGASLGLDVMQVRNDGVEGATMVAGSYVNPKTYLGVRQSAVFQTQTSGTTSTDASTEIEIEYELLQWLLVNFQGGVGDVRLMFRTRYAY